MNIKELRDAVDITPGLSYYEHALRCYAVELLEACIANKGLTIWDDMEKLGIITEADLLDGSSNWFEYSRCGNALIWSQDISMRLFGKKIFPGDQRELLLCQALVLSKAAGYLISCVNMLDAQKGRGDISLKLIELARGGVAETCPAIMVLQADD